jgi:hypothetical protein
MLLSSMTKHDFMEKCLAGISAGRCTQRLNKWLPRVREAHTKIGGPWGPPLLVSRE